MLSQLCLFFQRLGVKLILRFAFNTEKVGDNSFSLHAPPTFQVIEQSDFLLPIKPKNLILTVQTYWNCNIKLKALTFGELKTLKIGATSIL